MPSVPPLVLLLQDYARHIRLTGRQGRELWLRVELDEHFPDGPERGANGYCSAANLLRVYANNVDFFVDQVTGGRILPLGRSLVLGLHRLPP